MDVRELRYFVHVAELKSFSKAAIHIRIAQPALSRQIRKLEEELGVDLLIRSGRGLELTDSGKRLLRKAYLVLDQMEDMRLSVRSQENRIAGTLTIGVPPAAGEMLVPPVLIRCGDIYPGLRVDVVEGFSGYLYERLLNHELSLAIMHNPVAHRDLEIIPLLVEDMYLIGPAKPKHGLCPVDELACLRGIPLILPNQPHSLRALVESSMAEHDISINVLRQVDGLVIIRAMLRAGLGYSVLTYGSVHRDVQNGVLSARRLERPPITWKLCLVRRREANRREAVDALSEIVISEVNELASKRIWRGNPTHPAAN